MMGVESDVSARLLSAVDGFGQLGGRPDQDVASQIVAMPNIGLAVTSTRRRRPGIRWESAGLLCQAKNGRSIVSRWSRIGMSA